MNHFKKKTPSQSEKATFMKTTAKVTTLAAAITVFGIVYAPEFVGTQYHSASSLDGNDAAAGAALRVANEETSDGIAAYTEALEYPVNVPDTTNLLPAVTIPRDFVPEEVVGPMPAPDADAPSDESVSRSPHSKMSGPVAALAAAGGNGLVEIIARYDERPELFDDEYVASLGGEVTRSYATLDMRAISIPASSLELLAVSDNVDWLSLDDEISSTSTSAQVAMNVPSAGSPNVAYTGSSIGIAVLDTGVALHTDLGANVVQYSFLNGAYPVPVIVNGEIVDANDSSREDLFGHGTHVAGILTGSGASSNGNYTGTSGQANILSMQVLNGTGSGSMSDVMAALDWLLVYGSYYDVRVVNLSLGKGISESNTTDPLVIAVENLWDAGIVVVVAAGNEGFSGHATINSPGNSRKVITVGSLTDNATGADYSDDYISSFSSKGPTVGDLVLKPDLVAPGNRIVATIPNGSLLGYYLPTRLVGCVTVLGISTCEDAYLEMSGTSMATPMVAAAVALMLEKDPTLSPATVKARLMRSARKLDADPASAGTGLLDVDAALNDTGVIAGEALSPLVSSDPATDGVLIEDTAELWGDELWGAGYLFHGGFSWTAGAGVNSSGISASGYVWTDSSISANGYGWTNGGVHANGYGWTDGVNAKSLLDSTGTEGGVASLNDDP